MIALLVYLVVGYLGISGAVYLTLRATKKLHKMQHYEIENMTWAWPFFVGVAVLLGPFYGIAYLFVRLGDKLETRFSK